MVEARRLFADGAVARVDAVLLQRHLHADEPGGEDEKENSSKFLMLGRGAVAQWVERSSKGHGSVQLY